MKIVFIVFEAENYAIQLFSSILKHRGHQVYIIFDPRLFNTDEVRKASFARLFDIRKENVRKIKQISPDLVGFSVYTQDYRYALSFARMIKKELPRTPIIFGGIHCILCPEQVIKEDCVDMVCAGEGEEAIVELCEEQHSEIKNIWYKIDGFIKRNGLRPLIAELDSLPFIDRDILYQQKPVFKKDVSILTGRGCPYSCTFCASAALNREYKDKNLGHAVRKRSPANIINELTVVKNEYHPRSIYFVDDVFTMNLLWLKEFAKLYIKDIDLPFYCTANPATIREEELYLLKDMGCQMIGFGMQSCNEEYRIKYLKRYGSNEKIKQTAFLCHQLGIHFSFDHIFNLPNEPEENQIEAVKFYNETRPDIINTFTMTYLPKIELNKYLEENKKKEIENGENRTDMFCRNNDFYSTFFAFLPLFPRKGIIFLCNKTASHFIKLPYPIRLLLKDIKRLMIGRYSDVFFPIRLLLVNIRDNLLIKCGLR